jgi:protein-disulfide isomerase
MRIGALVAVLVVVLSMEGVGQSSPPLATVNGTTITSAEVDRLIATDLAKLEAQIYELRKAKLDALIEEQLLAQEAGRRGITTAALIESEVTAKQDPVSDEEVAVFYGANKAKLQGDLDAWRDQIRTFLAAQKAAQRRQAFVGQLRAQYEVDVFLKAPPVFRAEISIDGAFTKGPADAPITLVEYGDFHCPFCKRVRSIITQVLAKYDGRIRMVHKDFPLDRLHPQARAAAEAARCAGEQGKFWEFHDKIYAGEPDGTGPTMQRYAAELGLDAEKFEACRSTRKYQAQVHADLAEATMLGVSGTPAFFINGRLLSGAQPLEAFTRIIEEELATQHDGDSP